MRSLVLVVSGVLFFGQPAFANEATRCFEKAWAHPNDGGLGLTRGLAVELCKGANDAANVTKCFKKAWAHPDDGGLGLKRGLAVELCKGATAPAKSPSKRPLAANSLPAPNAAPSKLARGHDASPVPKPPRLTPSPNQSAPAQPPLPGAYRAALLIEAPDLPDKVKTYVGSVVWRLDSVPTGAGRPLGTAVHADVDVPDAKIRMSLDMQKNLDPSLPASHTINVSFTILPGSEIPGVKQIGAIQMRREDASNGDPLAGIPVQITDNLYLIELARGDIEARNMDLLKNRGWLDLPLALSNGRIAKFSLEKGASGDRVIDDAITAWDQQK